MTAVRGDQQVREMVLDERRRTSMARVGRPEHHKYLVEEFEDGTIVLTPAVTISAIELASLQDPNFHQALAQAKTGDVVRRPRRPRSDPTS